MAIRPLAVVGLLRELRVATAHRGPLCVAGAPALAEALRKELVRGGDPSAVRPGLAEDAVALVYVLAEPPSDADERTLAEAHRRKVPILVVLAAPELEPRVPYVLATDIVPIPAGSGFPIERITAVLARRVGESGTSLAARLPALRAAVHRELIESFSRRAGFVGAAVWVPGADMPAITITQLRLVLRIGAAHGVEIDQERLPEILAVVAGGYGLRAFARRLLRRLPLPGWAVRAAVAYGGTRAIGEAAVRYFEARSTTVSAAGA